MKIKIEDLTRDTAAEAFVQNSIIGECYESIITDVESLLEEGPGGSGPDQKQIAWQKWYLGLPKEDQEKVIEIAAYAVDLSLFHLLNILDGSSSIWPVEDCVSNYAVYLQTYSSYEDMESNHPDKAVLINELNPENDYLHDLFSYAMNDKHAQK